MRKDTYKFVVKRKGRIIHRDICFDLGKLASAWKAKYPDCQVIQIGQKTTISAAIKWKRRYERR